MNHIKSIHEDHKSWCGEILGIDFYFKSIEQAALNGLFPGNVEACVKCINECVTCLLKNINEDRNE